MNFTTNLLHILSSGAVAYLHASQLRDPLTRPNLLAVFQLSESGSVSFLETLSHRALAEGDHWLGEKLADHARDEQRHGQIFAYALKQLGKQAIDLNSSEPESFQEKEERTDPFYEEYFKGYTQESIKPDKIDWVVFIASTYILEHAASKDFVRMAKVLPEDEHKSRNLKKSLLSIAEDESRHASYLYEALHRRMSPQAAELVIDEWQTRKVNAIFAMMWNLIQKSGKLPPLVRDNAPGDTMLQASQLWERN